jgi:gliding motility-associated-like protein
MRYTIFIFGVLSSFLLQIQASHAQTKPASYPIKIFSTCLNCTPANGAQKNAVDSILRVTAGNAKPIPKALSTIHPNAVTPQIQASGNFYALNTTYGLASGSISFTVTGNDLQAGITVTPGNGFEVSIGGINFTNTVTVGAAGSVSATVYIRLAAKTNAGQYNGDITLSTAGAQNVTVNIPQGTVVPAQLNVWGKANKLYGEQLPAYIVFAKGDPGFVTDAPGLQNGNTAKSIKFTFSGGRNATDPVGNYSDKLTLSDFQGENGFLAGNYDIHYTGSIEMYIIPAPLSIAATGVNKAYGTILTDGKRSLGFTVTGLKNFENVGQVTMHYGAGAAALDPVGTYPLSVTPADASGGTISPNNYDITYKAADLTVMAAGPVLHNLGQLYTMQIVYGEGAGSSSAKIFVGGEYLTDNVTVTAPDGFIISLDDKSFGKTVQISPDGSGTILQRTIYIRLIPTAQVKQTYDSNVLLSTTGASLDVRVVGTVVPAPLAIKVNNVSKPYGTMLADIPSTKTFTVTGLKNSETVGNIAIKYGDGALATAAQGTYTASVIPYNAGGGTFSPDNYTITYIPADLTVGPPAPAISYTGQQLILQTVYGTPSQAQPINISGANLTSSITVSSPAGFQVSTDNSVFSNSVTLSLPGGTASAIVFIRLTAIAAAGSHVGDLVLSATGANNLIVHITANVTPAPLTVTAIPAFKVYGIKLNNASSTAFSTSGLQNGETVGSVMLTYGAGADATDHIGAYQLSITPSAATGGSFSPGNYTIQYVAAGIGVNKAPLTIKANDVAKAFLKPNPALTVTYTGFVNSDGPAQITIQPIISTTAELTSTPGKYPIVVSGADAGDYTISYIAGTLTIFPSSKEIKIYNVFSPNGDGVNDQWIINDLQYYPNCTVDIYNRYGQQIYFSRGYSHPWDGSYKGQAVPTGSYYYIINPNDGTANKFAGSLTVMR